VAISPNEEADFSREGVVDINAAVVGIHRTRWRDVEGNATKTEAEAIMRENRFDILPINSGPDVNKYFSTHKRNDYTQISEKIINHRDVIPFNTTIRDVIKGFASESTPRNFYFLHNERRIVGLISVVNLNCRQVKVYLFSLLSELELRLGKFITDHGVSEDELLQLTFGTKENNKYDNVKKRYEEDKKEGNDVPFLEYLYLSDLINIITKKKLCELPGYAGFAKLGSLVSLRDAVAHRGRGKTFLRASWAQH
jgi:hypothetical protein